MQVVLKFGSHIFSVCNLFEKHNTSIISDACGTVTSRIKDENNV